MTDQRKKAPWLRKALVGTLIVYVFVLALETTTGTAFSEALGDGLFAGLGMFVAMFLIRGRLRRTRQQYDEVLAPLNPEQVRQVRRALRFGTFPGDPAARLATRAAIELSQSARLTRTRRNEWTALPFFGITAAVLIGSGFGGSPACFVWAAGVIALAVFAWWTARNRDRLIRMLVLSTVADQAAERHLATQVAPYGGPPVHQKGDPAGGRNV